MLKFLLVIALIAFTFAGSANCGNSMVLEFQDEYVTSLDYAIQSVEAPKGACKDKLICEFPCNECLADPFLFDLTTTSLKQAYDKVCTNKKQTAVKQIIRDQMVELKLIAVQEKTTIQPIQPKIKKDDAFFQATQEELTLFAETVKRLCDDRIIPRAMPVQVINSLWDKYMAESTTIRGFLENLEKEVHIGQSITLDEVKRVGYGVLNKVVDEYTRPCLCRDVVQAGDKWGADPLEMTRFRIQGDVIKTQCALRDKAKCMFGGGEMSVPTPWGTITVNLQHGVVANRDGASGAVDISQITGKILYHIDNHGNGGKGGKKDNKGGSVRDAVSKLVDKLTQKPSGKKPTQPLTQKPSGKKPTQPVKGSTKSFGGAKGRGSK